MEHKNSVFIASSIDGYIADRDGGLDWLHSVPNPGNDDMGYGHFMDRIDAVVMGRSTFETVCNFGVEWPYNKPVFVLSSSLQTIGEEYNGKAELMHATAEAVQNELHQRGYKRLYIDGGRTIQGFLRADLIDELILTTIPVLLGGGSSLFAELAEALAFELLGTEVFLDEMVQRHYRRRR